MLVPYKVEIGPLVFEKKTRKTTTTTNDGQNLIRKSHLTFQLRLAKKVSMYCRPVFFSFYFFLVKRLPTHTFI